MISKAFQIVIYYIEADNYGDMNQTVIDQVDTLKDLQEKAQDEEDERKFTNKLQIKTLPKI